jgi:hypothetical protein
METFEEFLAAAGINPETMSEQTRLFLEKQWRLKSLPTGGGASTGAQSLDQITAEARAENARVQKITELAAAHLQQDPRNLTTYEGIARQAIDGKWTSEATELAMLRASRAPGPLIYSSSKPQVNDQVLEAALCQSMGLKSAEKLFDERTLQTAHSKFRGGLGLLQVLDYGARQQGWNGHSAKAELREVLTLAFTRPQRDQFGGRPGGSMAIGPSTINVSGILSNVANKVVREAFMFVDSSWKQLCSIRSVSDFKTVSSYSMVGDLDYKQVPPGGQIEHGTLGNESYTNKADTYARLIGIDRRDLYNDDLGAFAAVPRRLGRGGATKMKKVFWTEWMKDAATFYTAARLNYDDGTDTAFSNDGLTAALAIWRTKKDPDGQDFGSPPKFLVVPPAHEIPALRLMTSQFFGTTGEEGEQNPWAGRYTVVVGNELADSSFSGYSALAWYLACDPNDVALIEACFLNGQEMPTIETIDMDPDRLGLAMRGYHDFGIAKQEYRAGLKLKGEA